MNLAEPTSFGRGGSSSCPPSAWAFWPESEQATMHQNSIAFRFLHGFVLTLFITAHAAGADTPTAAELEPLGLEVRWNSQAVIDVNRDVVTHVSNDETNVYVQTSAGMITAFDAENGRKLWAQQTGRADEPTTAAVSNKDLVILVTGPMVFGFNKFTGTPVIKHRLARQPSSSPIMGEGIFYVPVSGGAIYAYSTSVLEHKFRYNTLPEDVPLSHLWRFICAEEIIFPPVNGQEALAFVTQAGNLHSVNTTGIERGRSRFQMQLKSASTAPPSIADNKSSSSVVMASGDNRVFSVDLIRGVVEWTYPMGRVISRQPTIIRDDVFLVSNDGTLTRFSRDDSSVDYGRPVEIPQYKGPVFIGAGMEDTGISQEVQDELETSGQGVRITTVVPGSAAERAGLYAGDILFRINGRTCGGVPVAQEMIQNQPLRVERNYEVVRVSTGMEFGTVTLDPPLNVEGGDPVGHAVFVTKVERSSIAEKAGIRQGDLILSVADQPASSTEVTRKLIAAAAPGDVSFNIHRGKVTRRTTAAQRSFNTSTRRTPTMRVAAGGRNLSIDLSLTVNNLAVSVERLKLAIPMKRWDVRGVESLIAVGRFSAFGLDESNRLVAFNLDTAEISGRVPVQGYNVHLNNAVTDQVYLFSSTGEVLCMREIGPTVRLPDLSTLSNQAVVTAVNVVVNDPIEATGTQVCEVEFPDGSTHQISSDHKGTVKRVYVKVGDTVAIDDPLVLIADDKFATYHRNPDQQPVDVNMQDPNAAPVNANP